jgi:hypothetical protein
LRLTHTGASRHQQVRIAEPLNADSFARDTVPNKFAGDRLGSPD